MLAVSAPSHAAQMIDHPIVKLQSLDKTTARTMTFEANVGSTVKFGSLYIKVQACRKAPPMEQPESASFLQIWETDKKKKPNGYLAVGCFLPRPVYRLWITLSMMCGY